MSRSSAGSRRGGCSTASSQRAGRRGRSTSRHGGARTEGLAERLTQSTHSSNMSSPFVACTVHCVAYRYALGLVRHAAGRLQAPELADAFHFWAAVSADERHAKQVEALQVESRSLEAQVRHLRHVALSTCCPSAP